MKIPKTTEEKPHIEFRFDKKGKLHLAITKNWWGGINAGFVSSNGFEGNTCPPKDLNRYIKAFKKRKIKTLDKEIAELQLKKEKYLTLEEL